MHDIMRMSWRRFKVLLHRGLELRHSDGTRAGEEAEAFDWNRALDQATGRETPTHVTRMSLEQLKSVVN